MCNVSDVHRYADAHLVNATVRDARARVVAAADYLALRGLERDGGTGLGLTPASPADLMKDGEGTSYRGWRRQRYGGSTKADRYGRVEFGGWGGVMYRRAFCLVHEKH